MKLDIKVPESNRARKVYDISADDMKRLDRACSKLEQGQKRDWLGIAAIVGPALDKDQDQSSGTVVTIDNHEELPPYALFILTMMDRMPSISKGSPRQFNGVTTPPHNGGSYKRLRKALYEELESKGVSRSDMGFINEDGTLIRFRIA